jgi:hypothetical protein
VKEAMIILTCPKFHDRAQACRDTWADDSPIPVIFHTGETLNCSETISPQGTLRGRDKRAHFPPGSPAFLRP